MPHLTNSAATLATSPIHVFVNGRGRVRAPASLLLLALKSPPSNSDYILRNLLSPFLSRELL
ncbi:MAG: hypothetical protein AB7G17_04750 [Phycisphaerales bacterium]